MQIRAAGLECGKEVVRALGGASDKAAQLVSALLVVIDIQAQRPNTIGKSSSMPTLAKSGSSAALAEAVEPTKEVRGLNLVWLLPARPPCARRSDAAPTPTSGNGGNAQP